MYQEHLAGFRNNNHSFFEFKPWNHTVVAQSDSVKTVYLDFLVMIIAIIWQTHHQTKTIKLEPNRDNDDDGQQTASPHTPPQKVSTTLLHYLKKK